jgi:GNAT superfamily N-acetyltransferase
MELRPMLQSDDLMPFVLAAMNWRDDGRWDAASMLATPELAHYVTDWMRPGDAGVIAIEEGIPAGAAWWRHFSSVGPGYGYVADDVPELGMAVLEPFRRRGAAGALLDALISRARAEGLRAVSLSVEDGNDVARLLYEGRGFVPCGRVGDSDIMLLALRR